MIFYSKRNKHFTIAAAVTLYDDGGRTTSVTINLQVKIYIKVVNVEVAVEGHINIGLRLIK